MERSSFDQFLKLMESGKIRSVANQKRYLNNNLQHTWHPSRTGSLRTSCDYFIETTTLLYNYSDYKLSILTLVQSRAYHYLYNICSKSYKFYGLILILWFFPNSSLSDPIHRANARYHQSKQYGLSLIQRVLRPIL